MKVQRLPPSARHHARQDLVTMESATTLSIFWCDLHNGTHA